MPPLKILVADADDFTREDLRRSLERCGHRVVTAASGDAAIRMLRTLEFDVLITEILMPDGDGIDVINFTKRMHSPIRIIAMSAGGRYLTRDECLKLAKPLGAHAIAVKPLPVTQLLAVIEEAMALPAPNLAAAAAT